MNSPIYDFFELVLAGTMHFTPDYFEKSLEFLKAMSKKDLKFILCYRHQGITTNLLFMLLPAVQELIFQEINKKKDFILAYDSHINKIVFILLTKIITFYMCFTIIYVWGLGLKWLFSALENSGVSSARS